MKKILTFAAATLVCTALANANNVDGDAPKTAHLNSSVAIPRALATVPEPDSWILIAVGVALAAAGMHRRART